MKEECDALATIEMAVKYLLKRRCSFFACSKKSASSLSKKSASFSKKLKIKANQ